MAESGRAIGCELALWGRRSLVCEIFTPLSLTSGKGLSDKFAWVRALEYRRFTWTLGREEWQRFRRRLQSG